MSRPLDNAEIRLPKRPIGLTLDSFAAGVRLSEWRQRLPTNERVAGRPVTVRTGTGWEAGFPETCSRLCFPEMPHRRWRNGTVAHSSGGRFREAVAIDRTAMLLAFPITPFPTPSPPCYLATRRPHISASARNSMPPPAADRQRSACHRHVGFPLRTGRAIRPVIRARAAPRACIFGAAGMAGPGTWPWSGSLICRIRTRAQHPPHPFGERAHVRFAHFGRMAGGGGEGPSPHDVA